MNRKLRILLGAGLLLPELLCQMPLLHAQEAAVINSEPAVRFEQSPGFFHYAALCRTATAFMAQMPPGKVPYEATEPAVCWYVKASNIHAAVKSGDSNAGTDGKLVISAHHIRFIPHNPQLSAFYADLPPEHTVLGHEPGQAYALLRSNDLVLNFRFSKLCPSCAPGTPIAPGFHPALLDQEFSLLDDSLRHFDSGWKRIHRLSSTTQIELASRNHTAGPDGSTGPHPGTEPALAGTSKPVASVSNPSASNSSKPFVPADSHRAPAAAPGPTAGTPPKPSNSAGPAVTGLPNPGASSSIQSTAGPGTPSATAPKAPDPPPAQTSKDGLNVVEIAPQTAAELLVRGVEPVYPIAAKQAGLQGKVLLRVIIGETGEVSAVAAISGPPQLEFAAVDAVRQWRYRPYLVDGQPVQVETTIEVGFSLNGSQSFVRAANHP